MKFRRKAKSRRKGFRMFAKRRGHKGGASANLTGVILGGAVYGAGRQYVSNLAAPLTSKVPLGNYADNAVMGLLSYFLAKGKIPLLNKVPMSRDIGKAGLYIESAMLGQELLGKTGLINGSSSTSQGW